MYRKEIQMSRMWQYFVDATAQIIEEEGIKNVTARKVAVKAGYTSSTIYNYFGDLSQLIFFASMRFINDYIKEVPGYMDQGETYLEKYILSWECFCNHSFKQPEIYHAIFIADLGETPKSLLENYYAVYNNDLIGIPDEIKMLLLEHNLTKRNKALLEKSIKEKFQGNEYSNEIVEEVNEMCVLIWQGTMSAIMNKRMDYEIEKVVENTIKYMRYILESKIS
ncbi:TetR/AcrR family transcriptional regulator [Lysinibacillus agricola]|uniref:TetR/AcrR family transcriptional regulator n=1 Tax=Lysinibacillus agricola TaxID=2590012 RepID=A0ABX7AXL1_9BACI|nr:MULTISPECIES: TetR/AcrR family transcriptional regulator [Lysinibacillus]KOS60251.1 TetR family transcriptional regulator [Lysinibacillus sp. FJAT-14222]QQP14541.1 TetR/AcrR family transcriptional regulator [Lysinibacillus agricola]